MANTPPHAPLTTQQIRHLHLPDATHPGAMPHGANFTQHPPGADVRRIAIEDIGPFEGHGLTAPHRPGFANARTLPNARSLRQDYLALLPKDLRSKVTPAPSTLVDPRYPYFDTAYPWSAFGRITTGGYGPGLAGSGVMVGPRHVLFSSGMVGWHGNGPTDWLVFTPCYYNGVTPFGADYVETVFYWRQVPLIYYLTQTGLIALNFVVGVLNTRLGETTGWIGSRTYDQSWDGAASWALSSYSVDFAFGQEPTFQNDVAIQGSSFPPDANPPGQGMMLPNDATIGDFPPFEEGAPLFSWWPGDAGPSTIGVHAFTEVNVNPVTIASIAGGGLPMVRLIQQALAEFP